MPKQEMAMEGLARFLPIGALEPVLHYLKHYAVQLTITRHRHTILGNYKLDRPGGMHRISVNGTLNPYAFLITLLHELAHLIQFQKHKRSFQPHGKEWKAIFSELLKKFLEQGLFPTEVEAALRAHLAEPAASSCADPALVKALRAWDAGDKKTIFVEDLATGDVFQDAKGRLFRLVEKRRTRYLCEELETARKFSFSAVAQVAPVKSEGD